MSNTDNTSQCELMPNVNTPNTDNTSCNSLEVLFPFLLNVLYIKATQNNKEYLLSCVDTSNVLYLLCINNQNDKYQKK